MPFDYLLKPVAVDHEIWFGFALTGWWATATKPLHRLIYSAGAYGFWKMRPGCGHGPPIAVAPTPHPFPFQLSSHPLLLNNRTVAGQCFHDALNDLAEQALQLLSRRWPHATEFHYTILNAVNAVKHQAMQMNIEISGRTETLDE